MGDITYRCLNKHEFEILSRRPLIKEEVYSLWRSTLRRFLICNCVQFNIRVAKRELVELVMQLLEPNYEYCPEYEPPHGAPYELQGGPYVPESQDNSVCHICPHVPLIPIMIPLLPNDEACQGLQQCNAVLQNFDGDDEDVTCTCSIPMEYLLQNISLSEEAQVIFLSKAYRPIMDIVSFLEDYGVQVHNSGCRVYLLLMLRDLLQEQFRALQALPATEAVAGPSNNGAAASGNSGINELAYEFSELMSDKGATISGSNASKKKEEIQIEDDEPSKECCICLQNPREIAFVPCGHLVCCNKCAKKLKECAVCRKKVEKHLKVFMS